MFAVYYKQKDKNRWKFKDQRDTRELALSVITQLRRLVKLRVLRPGKFRMVEVKRKRGVNA
jgi:hypothetical protein